MPTPPPLPARLPYQPGFDNLRGVAALGVCLFHLAGGQLPTRELVHFTQVLFSPGYLGVDVFFVLSGYILPYSLLRQGYQLRQFGVYLRRRLLRINPPAYAAMLLTLGLYAATDALVWHRPHYLVGITPWQLLHNFFFTATLFRQGWLVSVCWTLAAELEFYLFLGLLFPLLFTRRRSGWWFGGAFLGLCGLFWLPDMHLSLVPYAPLFALGGAALLWQQGSLGRVGFGACLLVFGGLATWLPERFFPGTGPAVAVASLLTVGAILAGFRPVPGLAFVGKISYSLYLTHLLAGRTTEFVVSHFLPPTSDLHRTLTLTLCVLGALGFATLFHYSIERPCIRLAQRLGSSN